MNRTRGMGTQKTAYFIQSDIEYISSTRLRTAGQCGKYWVVMTKLSSNNATFNMRIKLWSHESRAAFVINSQIDTHRLNSKQKAQKNWLVSKKCLPISRSNQFKNETCLLNDFAAEKSSLENFDHDANHRRNPIRAELFTPSRSYAYVFSPQMDFFPKSLALLKTCESVDKVCRLFRHLWISLIRLMKMQLELPQCPFIIIRDSYYVCRFIIVCEIQSRQKANSETSSSTIFNVTFRTSQSLSALLT